MPHNSYFFVLFPVIFFLFPYLSLVQYNTIYLLLLPIHSFPPLSCLDSLFLSLLAYSIIGTPRALSSLFPQYSTTHNVRYQRRPHLTSFIEQPNRNPTTPLHPITPIYKVAPVKLISNYLYPPSITSPSL